VESLKGELTIKEGTLNEAEEDRLRVADLVETYLCEMKTVKGNNQQLTEQLANLK
jgi:hypothetical protein